MKYIIPANSALPDELKHLTVLTGTLLERLAAFEKQDASILPLTDIEMNGIARSPELFTFGEVEVIMSLPGGFSSAIFDSAVATAGYPARMWDEIRANLKRASTESQRVKDTAPWHLKGKDTRPEVDALPPAEEDA